MKTTKDYALDLDALMDKHSKFGAADSEGFNAVSRIEEAILTGKSFPLTGENPFDLYQSQLGWEAASAELIAAGRNYWKMAIIENMGLTMEELAPLRPGIDF
jgi:hypothetical protein